jgi:oligosaccharide repeat unit polymerase
MFFQYYVMMRLAGVGGYLGIGNLLSFYRVQSTYTLSEESMNGIVLMGMRILQVVAYLASFAFVNNVFALKEGWRKNVGYLVPVVLFCVSMLLGTSRGRVLWMLVFWMVVSFYLTWRASGWKERQSARYFRRGLTVAAIGLPLFYYSANLVGRVSQLTHGMKEYLGIYFGGSIAHFNQYIESPPPPDSHFGEEIFLNIYTFLHGLGLSDYQRLIHLEFRYVNANTRGNIYTFFRRPLQDFGLSGMLLVAFIVAAIFTYVLCRHIKGQQPSPKGDLVILLYGYFFFLIAGSSLENMLFEYLAVSKIMIVVLLIFCYRLFFNDQEPLFARKRSRRLRRRALAGKGLSHAAS